ncbi:B- and T-lymphocyte attenuator isoform X2 [Morone saxatilis]|uniref:B- and T-lymphocyte attenuator isoform X2 n=1 Tax=Morone saxatilis TaxID=34816 RepID=UPI0015E20204|nr:B- and T-lymphocyte attenuator isoform X2 [Morone saxatilis]
MVFEYRTGSGELVTSEISPCSSKCFRLSSRSPVMLSLMDRLPYIYLLAFHCFTFVCTYGGHHGVYPSCDVELKVRRSTGWKVPPQQGLTVKCPVKHCGESLNITWCKLLDTNKCERIHEAENVEIKQNDEDFKDEVISFLTFKRISIDDDGLYRCSIKVYKYNELISHIINISVSDLHHGINNSENNAYSIQGISNSENDAYQLPIVADHGEESWLPYFYICFGVAFLVATLTALTLLRLHGWKRILLINPKKGQEMSTHMIPDLPRGSDSSGLVLQTHFSALNDIYSSITAERPPSQPPPMSNGNQPAVTNTANESQVTDHAVYAVINHRQFGRSAREQQTASKQNSQYAAINVS